MASSRYVDLDGNIYENYTLVAKIVWTYNTPEERRRVRNGGSYDLVAERVT